MFSHLHDHSECFVYESAESAVAAIKEMYARQIEILKTIGQKDLTAIALQASTYPMLSINIADEVYCSSMGRPDLFETYYLEECKAIEAAQTRNKEAKFCVSKSNNPIPLALVDEDLAYGLTEEQMAFRKINILSIEAVEEVNGQKMKPLNWFHPTRTDYSINRLKHYTGVSAEYLQDYIIFVNYQKYLPYFIEYAKCAIANGLFEDLIGPGDTSLIKNKMQIHESWNDSITLPQMPAYNLIGPNRQGISLVNIGVGASNAKTMADHLSVLRPRFALMVGHCGGLQAHHVIGDYIFGTEHLMIDFDNIHKDSLTNATYAEEIAKYIISEKKYHIGPVVSVSDRNWELHATQVHDALKTYDIIGIDMEAAMVVKTFLQHGIPAGSLLCISDRPFHREIRLQKMAQNFYSSKLEMHLMDSLNIMNEFAKQKRRPRPCKDQPLFR